ncbi:condensin-2 complex subunit d3-like protein [Sesbania bispinosa]|nr:condensin-2 complex subunit d3-like protein [Sesbania bispinosa]
MPKSQARTFALGFITSLASSDFDGVKKTLVESLRYLVKKALDKAEPTTLVVDSVTEVVRVMEFMD